MSFQKNKCYYIFKQFIISILFNFSIEIILMEKSIDNHKNSKTLPSNQIINTGYVKACPIKVKPQLLHFINVEKQTKYQMHFIIKNQGNQSQKIRIIYPTSQYFVINNQLNPAVLAPGLNLKISIHFQFKAGPNVMKDTFQDTVLILGDNFKTEVRLKASKPNFVLVMPKIYKLGIVKLAKQMKFSIAIKNIGKQDVEITQLKASSPKIILENSKMMVKKQTSIELIFKFMCKTAGVIEQFIEFPNGEIIQLKGVCSEQSIQIYQKNGHILKTHNFGIILIGEKIIYPIYMVNNSPERIEGLIKIFDKNKSQYTSLKIDQNKLTFINRGNPQKIVQQQKQISLKCSNYRFSIQPFKDFQNNLIILKQPNIDQLKLFSEQTFKNPDVYHRQTSYNSFNQIEQILYIKIIDRPQTIKIPIQYVPTMPRIYISQDKFQFKNIEPKQLTKINFIIKNCNEKAMKINFQNKKPFYFEGNTTIQAGQTQQFNLCFRPLIGGEYSQIMKLKLLDFWSINLKVYGKCNKSIKQKVDQNKQNFKITIKKSESLGNYKTTRYLSNQRKKRIQIQKINNLKNKLTELTTLGFLKNPDEPKDLIFDAGQNPKVISQKKLAMQFMKSVLFFNNQKYIQSLAQKNKAIPVSISQNRLNVKQLVKFSEQLTPIQLSKIQVKCERLDFGNLFLGSSTQKDFIISNKNNKSILVQIDLGKSEAICQTKTQIKKIQPFAQAIFTIKIKPIHLGILRIPLTYTINKQYMFQLDILANITLINLGFSTKQLNFCFNSGDLSLQKIQNLIVINHGTTYTKFVIIQPLNKAFTIINNKQQQLSPKSSTNIAIKYKPLQGTQTGQLRTDIDKLIVKVVGGAQNTIKCQGKVIQSKYAVKQSQINFSQVFISMLYQHKLIIRNLIKSQTAVTIEMNPPTLSQVINLDQRNFILNSEQKKQINFNFISHDVKNVKGFFIINSRGGKTYKIPINISFYFPLVQVVGGQDIDLGTIHIMKNHFQRQISLINRMKTQIKLQTCETQNKNYIVQFSQAHEKVQLVLKDTIQDSYKNYCQKFGKLILIEDRIGIAGQIKSPKNMAKILTLPPGIQTKWKIKFIPKIVNLYQLKIPLFLHKSVREVQPICQKIKCRAVQPLFYVKPYSLDFSNVVTTQNEFAYKKQFQIINSHDKKVDWHIFFQTQDIKQLFSFNQFQGELKPKQCKKIIVYFHPNKQGQYHHKIKLFSNIDRSIQVQLQINGHAVSPKIKLNKNILILPVVPIKNQSKAVIEIQNYGYETVTISKAKFTHNFEGIDLRYTFLDGKLLSLSKKKSKIQISFKSENPISFTTNLQIFNQYGDKISIPVSGTADHCLLTTYQYLETNNSTVILDNMDSCTLKLLDSKTFASKNKQIQMSENSAVTGHFIKNWCNYELNINMQHFPNDLVESKGQLLYQIIVKMTNGRVFIKKPSILSEQKINKVIQLHNYYTQVIKALQVQGAFLNHTRPQFLLNMNDYLVYMFHKECIIEQDQFQFLSHDAWTTLFYQLCKLYVEPQINDKFIQKLNYKYKPDKSINSCIYSESQILVLGFINEYLGDQKIYSFDDKNKLFQVVQRILQKTFKISLSEQISKLKISNSSFMVHQFLASVSKFLFSQLQQFGLSMFLQANDLFTMGHKEFLLFFISLMQNLINFQTYSLIQFDSAYGEKNQKIIELSNPSKKKKIKYWVKIYGSNNFKSNQKQIQIDGDSSAILKIIYHCKKNSNQQAQLILVPVKEQSYFNSAQFLNFMLKNTLISKTVMKKINMKVHIYDIKTVNLDVELPIIGQSVEYDIKLISNQYTDELNYQNYYLLQSGKRIIKNGKQRCQIKIAPLELAELLFKVILVSNTLQEYIYEFNICVGFPKVSQIFKLQSMTTQIQQKRTIKIPLDNELKQQCLKFHCQMNKQKEKKKKYEKYSMPKSKIKLAKIKSKHKYVANFLEESTFILKQNFVELGTRNKNQANQCKLQILGEFNKPCREYKSMLLVKNQELQDYRIYALITSVTIKPKIYQLKMFTKARQLLKLTIPNKMNPFIYRLQKNIPEIVIQQLPDSTQLLVSFNPQWILKQQLQLYIQSPQTFQQDIYKIKLQSSLPQPVKTIQLLTSTLFRTNFQIDLTSLKICQKQLLNFQIRSDIRRKHQLQIKQKKLIGYLYPQLDQSQYSIKLTLPKSHHYYEYILNLKNLPIIDLKYINLSQNIGETKKYIIKQIQNTKSNFYCQYQKQNYLQVETTQLLKQQQLQKQNKNQQKSKINNKAYFCIVFKPSKEMQCQKIFKFRSDNKQYILRICLSANKLQPISIPVILTQNLDKKSTAVVLPNMVDVEVEGVYQAQIVPQYNTNAKSYETRFKLDTNNRIEYKTKDKNQLKIKFHPIYIGDNIRQKLVLKSNTLPQLTYYLQGISKFKFKQIYEQIQCFQAIKAVKQLKFINQFAEKQRFRFQLNSNSDNFIINQGLPYFNRDIEPGQSITFNFTIKNPNYNLTAKQYPKIAVIKTTNKKIIKQYNFQFTFIKNLDDKKYCWECKARQTIFQTIILPKQYILKQIKTDKDIQKYITFNLEDKNCNQVKIKFTPLKPIKARVISILLITKQIKFKILCHVKIMQPMIDDVITIRTAEIKQTGVAIFRLTNIARQPTHYRAYFQKNYQQLQIEQVQGILQSYGKTGTPITIKFKSEIHNKKVQDRLIIQTENMYWIFKVIGLQSRILNF